MRTSVYPRVVKIISECSTRIRVIDSETYKVHNIVINGQLRQYADKTLTLRKSKEYGRYQRERTWMISQFEIEKAFKKYCKKHPSVKARVKNSVNSLTPTDVEQIIKIASYDMINLRLVTVLK